MLDILLTVGKRLVLIAVIVDILVDRGWGKSLRGPGTRSRLQHFFGRVSARYRQYVGCRVWDGSCPGVETEDGGTEGEDNSSRPGQGFLPPPGRLFHGCQTTSGPQRSGERQCAFFLCPLFPAGTHRTWASLYRQQTDGPLWSECCLC